MYPPPLRQFAPVMLLGLCFGFGRLTAADPRPAPLAEEVFPQLEVILTQAIAQSPTMLQKNLDVIQAEASRIQSVAALYPSVGASVSYSFNTSSVAASTASPKSKSDGVYYSISLSQPIFHWGTIKAAADAARVGVKIAERNYAEAYRNLVQTLRSQYLALIVKKIALRNARFSLKVAESSLALDEERLRGGSLSPGDIIPSRLAVEESRLIVDRSEEDYVFVRNFIVRLAGLDALADADIPDEIPQAKLKMDAGLAGTMLSKFEHGGVEDTNQALTYYFTIKQSELNYKQAKYRLYPKVGLGAAVSQANSTSASGDVVVQTGVFSQSVGITAGWTLFDGFATRGAKMSALTNRRVAERQLANYIDQSVDQARSQERQMSFAYRAMDLANVRRELIVGAVERAEDDLKRGFGAQGVVDTVTLSLNNYTLIANSSRAEFLTRAADFISLVGSDPILEKLPARFNAPVSRKK